jgi:hypothetical protein
MKRNVLLVLSLLVLATSSVRGDWWEAAKLSARHPILCSKFLWNQGLTSAMVEAKEIKSAKEVGAMMKEAEVTAPKTEKVVMTITDVSLVSKDGKEWVTGQVIIKQHPSKKIEVEVCPSNK